MELMKKTFKLHPLGVGILFLLIPMVACSKPEINPNPPTPTPEAPVIDWKTELQNIDPLIEKRELDASAIPQAISQLQKLEKTSPSNPEIYAQLARAQYFLGQYSSSREKKLYEFRR
ncbi:MAG TPA: hypothetical protein VJL87_04895, partial [Bdellovibrionota bacterium]|nr:hypothetical protein [Bdellovibrionota bacterium]